MLSQGSGFCKEFFHGWGDFVAVVSCQLSVASGCASGGDTGGCGVDTHSFGAFSFSTDEHGFTRMRPASWQCWPSMVACP